MDTQTPALKRRQQYRRIFKAVLFGIWVLFFVGGMLVTAYFFQKHGLDGGIQILESALHTYTDSIVWGVLALYLLRSVIFIPISALGALLGIVLEGQLLLAVFLATLGAILSGFLSFGIARLLGRKWVATHESARFQRFDEAVSKRGFITIFILRILLFIPFDLISLFSGFSGMRFRDYAWATVLGVIPEVAVQVLLGNSITHPKNLFILGGVFLIVLALGYYLKTHPHFREIINPIKRIQKMRQKRNKNRKKRKSRKRF